jgi:hypothetical protein
MLISTQFWNSLLFRGCVYSTLLTYIVPLLDNTLGVNLFSLVLHRYFIAVQKCLGLYSENGQYCTNVDRLCTLYISLKKEYGWSSAVKRMPLDFLGGEKFQEAADNYVRPLLTKVNSAALGRYFKFLFKESHLWLPFVFLSVYLIPFFNFSGSIMFLFVAID